LEQDFVVLTQNEDSTMFYMRFFLLFFFISTLNAQNKRDYQWIIGGSSGGNGILIDFNDGSPNISPKKTGLWMDGANTSMCDEEGRLLFYSDGCRIMNARNKIMKNGDSINPGILQRYFCPSGGSTTRQGVLSLPVPNSDSIYYLFNLDAEQIPNFNPMTPRRLYFQSIDMKRDSGLGAVVQKNQIAILDTFSRGYMTATRHANGNDWWILVPKALSNCYWLLRLNSEGIQAAELKCAGQVWSVRDDGGGAVFSPNGKKYIRFNEWNGLNIFDFDNSTGELSKPLHLMFPNDTIRYSANVAVSPNSRFLYAFARSKVYQFDLQAQDVLASKTLIAVWDGYSNPAATLFHMSALGPDGKIYISTPGSTYNLHVIHHPNCPGLKCGLEQHGVLLPAYNYTTIPNLPHFRNEENSSCESSSTDLKRAAALHVLVYPNPCEGMLWIQTEEAASMGLIFNLMDLTGRVVLSAEIENHQTELDLKHLVPGAYYYTVNALGGAVLAAGKIVREGR
jgi:hypothetical protein